MELLWHGKSKLQIFFLFVEAALSYKMERLVKNNIGKIIVIQRKRWKWALMLEW